MVDSIRLSQNLTNLNTAAILLRDKSLAKGVRGPVIVPFICAKFPFHSQPLSLEEFENTPRKYKLSTSDLLTNASDYHDLSYRLSIL